MSKLPKYTLKLDKKKSNWALVKDGSDRATRRFETKSEATSAGTLKSALGKEGGSVKIQKTNGKYQEERTFPRSKDPTSSEG